MNSAGRDGEVGLEWTANTPVGKVAVTVNEGQGSQARLGFGTESFEVGVGARVAPDRWIPAYQVYGTYTTDAANVPEPMKLFDIKRGTTVSCEKGNSIYSATVNSDGTASVTKAYEDQGYINKGLLAIGAVVGTVAVLPEAGAVSAVATGGMEAAGLTSAMEAMAGRRAVTTLGGLGIGGEAFANPSGTAVSTGLGANFDAGPVTLPSGWVCTVSHNLTPDESTSTFGAYGGKDVAYDNSGLTPRPTRPTRDDARPTRDDARPTRGKETNGDAPSSDPHSSPPGSPTSTLDLPAAPDLASDHLSMGNPSSHTSAAPDRGYNNEGGAAAAASLTSDAADGSGSHPPDDTDDHEFLGSENAEEDFDSAAAEPARHQPITAPLIPLQAGDVAITVSPGLFFNSVVTSEVQAITPSGEPIMSVVQQSRVPSIHTQSALTAGAQTVVFDSLSSMLSTTDGRLTPNQIARHTVTAMGTSFAASVISSELGSAQSVLGNSSGPISANLARGIYSALHGDNEAMRRAAFESSATYALNTVAGQYFQSTGVLSYGRAVDQANGSLFGGGLISATSTSDTVSVGVPGVPGMTIGAGFQRSQEVYRKGNEVWHREAHGLTTQARFGPVSASNGWRSGAEVMEHRVEVKDGIRFDFDAERSFSGQFNINMFAGNRGASWNVGPAWRSKTHRSVVESRVDGNPFSSTYYNDGQVVDVTHPGDRGHELGVFRGSNLEDGTHARSPGDLRLETLLNPGADVVKHHMQTLRSSTSESKKFGMTKKRANETFELGTIERNDAPSSSEHHENGLNIREVSQRTNVSEYTDRTQLEYKVRRRFHHTKHKVDNTRVHISEKLTETRTRKVSVIERDGGGSIEERGSTDTSTVAASEWARREEDMQKVVDSSTVDRSAVNGGVSTTIQEETYGQFHQSKVDMPTEEVRGDRSYTTHHAASEAGAFSDVSENHGKRQRVSEQVVRRADVTMIEARMTDPNALLEPTSSLPLEKATDQKVFNLHADSITLQSTNKLTTTTTSSDFTDNVHTKHVDVEMHGVYVATQKESGSEQQVTFNEAEATLTKETFGIVTGHFVSKTGQGDASASDCSTREAMLNAGVSLDELPTGDGEVALTDAVSGIRKTIWTYVAKDPSKGLNPSEASQSDGSGGTLQHISHFAKDSGEQNAPDLLDSPEHSSCKDSQQCIHASVHESTCTRVMPTASTRTEGGILVHDHKPVNEERGNFFAGATISTTQERDIQSYTRTSDIASGAGSNAKLTGTQEVQGQVESRTIRHVYRKQAGCTSLFDRVEEEVVMQSIKDDKVVSEVKHASRRHELGAGAARSLTAFASTAGTLAAEGWSELWSGADPDGCLITKKAAALNLSKVEYVRMIATQGAVNTVQGFGQGAAAAFAATSASNAGTQAAVAASVIAVGAEFLRIALSPEKTSRSDSVVRIGSSAGTAAGAALAMSPSSAISGVGAVLTVGAAASRVLFTTQDADSLGKTERMVDVSLAIGAAASPCLSSIVEGAANLIGKGVPVLSTWTGRVAAGASKATGAIGVVAGASFDTFSSMVRVRRAYKDPKNDTIISKWQMKLCMGEAIVDGATQVIVVLAGSGALAYSAVMIGAAAAFPVAVSVGTLVTPYFFSPICKLYARKIYRRLCKAILGYDPNERVAKERREKEYKKLCQELGINPDISDAEFKKKMRRAWLDVHPDKGGNDANCIQVMGKWNAAQELRVHTSRSTERTSDQTWKDFLATLAAGLLRKLWQRSYKAFSRVRQLLTEIGFEISDHEPAMLDSSGRSETPLQLTSVPEKELVHDEECTVDGDSDDDGSDDDDDGVGDGECGSAQDHDLHHGRHHDHGHSHGHGHDNDVVDSSAESIVATYECALKEVEDRQKAMPDFKEVIYLTVIDNYFK